MKLNTNMQAPVLTGIDPKSLQQVYEFRYGRHKDKLITEISDGYLYWMVENDHDAMEYAIAELNRRGLDPYDNPANEDVDSTKSLL